MGKYKFAIIVFNLSIFLSIGAGFLLKNNYKTVVNDSMKKSEYNTMTNIYAALHDSYFNKEDYSTYFDDNRFLLKVKVLDKKALGNIIISEVEVLESYAKNSVTIGSTIKIIEEYTILRMLDGSYEETSNSLYIPMVQGREYIVNVDPWEVSNKYYKFHTLNFSCYEISDSYQTMDITEDVIITHENKVKPIYFIIANINDSDDLKKIFENVNLADIAIAYNESQKIITKQLNVIINKQHLD